MFDLFKDLVMSFLGALLVECSPRLALRLVRLAARAMPTPELREQLLSDWTAEVLSVEGNAQKLVVALAILVNVPSIRSSYGASRFRFTPDVMLTFSLIGMIVCQVLLVVVGLFGLTFAFGTMAWAAYQSQYLSAAERLALQELILTSEDALQTLWYSVPITLVVYFLPHLKKWRKGAAV